MNVKLPVPASRRGLRAAVVATAACIAFAAAGTAALAEDSRPVAGDTTRHAASIRFSSGRSPGRAGPSSGSRSPRLPT